MSRFQLALNVADLQTAIEFYSKFFGAKPAKVRRGYANFALEAPPLKLVLIEDTSQTPGSLNHLGVEVESVGQLLAERSRLSAAGLMATVEDEVSCCYALQDKVWVESPGGKRWEIYTILADAELPAGPPGDTRPSSPACCVTHPDSAGVSPSIPECC